MNPIEITLQAPNANERAIPPGKPVYMLNLLRYPVYARYEDGFEAAPCSGRDALMNAIDRRSGVSGPVSLVLADYQTVARPVKLLAKKQGFPNSGSSDVADL
jgi:hypothetical protein